jgi:2-oxoglutarate dehydrogenase E2 component (dihydrolipoamide succinyltransferase)
MATDVIMPQMGESIAEGTITKWLVKVGDEVERDQPLFEISTDKVDAEIPSPTDGVLLEIRHAEGETVEVNQVVARIGEAGEQLAEEVAEAGMQPEAESGLEAEPEPGVEPAPETEVEPSAAEELATEVEAEPETEAAPEGKAMAQPPSATGEEVERIRTFSSPVVRKMAAEHGVDLAGVVGTGSHGRVTKRDLEAHLEGGARPTGEDDSAAPGIASARAAAPAAASPLARREPGEFHVPAYTEGEPVVIEPMSRIRQITAAHMAYSKATSAHVTTVVHIDMSRVAKVRQRAKTGFLRAHGAKLTYMPFIFKAVAAALKAHPKLNSSIDGTNIVFKKQINLGMAVALDWGLIVPVIRNADQLNLVGLAKAANDLAERARSKKLSPDEIQGGTFTVTNPGVFGSLIGTPIINQPQVAILGIGAIEKRPVVAVDADGNDTIAIKTMSYFSISFDHRLVDGADADHFMNSVRKTLAEESWGELDAFD